MRKSLCVSILVFCVLLLFWECASRFYSDMLFVLPAPTQIAARMGQRGDRLLFHTLVTVKEMGGGFFLALLFAFPLAWAMLQYQSVSLVLQPLFVVIQCIPMFTLAPIMVLWFDWSYVAIVVPTALMIFFPLTVNIYRGFCSVPIALQEYFHVNRATSLQTFVKLQLPFALPQVFAGFRISAAIAGVGAVAGEWAGAQAGLGVLMLESRRGADLEMTFGALTCLVAVSVMFYLFMVVLERIVRRRDLGRAFLTCLLLLFSLSSCQNAPKEKRVRTALDWFPNPNHVPLYVGVQKGFFLEKGIDVEIKKLPDPSDAIPLVTSGQAELGVSYMPHTMRALAKQAPIAPVGILVQEPLNAIVFQKNRGISCPEDLNGRVIGYCVDGSESRFLDATLKKRGIEPSEKRNVQFDLVSTLGTNRVDAIYGACWNIECEQLRSFGLDVDFFPLSAFSVPTYYELIFIARKGSEQEKEAFVIPFQQALQKSINYCLKYPEEAFQIYAETQPDKGEKTLSWEERAWQKTQPTLARSQTIDPDVWHAFGAWLTQHGLM